MAKDGESFELLTKRIFELLVENPAYTTVEHNVDLPGPDGSRQIDVLIRAQVASMNLLTIIECRDHGRNLTITDIDGLHSKMQDVKANKAILVARKGFSKTAKRKAERLGITLCTASSAESDLWNVGLEVPIIWTVIRFMKISYNFTAQLKGGTTLSTEDSFYQMVLNILCQAIQNGQCPTPLTSDTFEWVPPLDIAKQLFVDIEGIPLDVDEYTFRYSVEVDHYFGYLQDLPSAIGLENHTDEKKAFFFRGDDMFNYKKHLTRFDKFEEIPKVEGLTIFCIKQETGKLSDKKLEARQIG